MFRTKPKTEFPNVSEETDFFFKQVYIFGILINFVRMSSF